MSNSSTHLESKFSPIIIVWIVLAFVNTVQAEWPSDKDVDGLKGPVQSATIEADGRIYRRSTYDENGVLIGGTRSISISSPNNSITHGSNVYVYDEKGRLKEQKIQILADGGGTKEIIWTHEYESKGDMTEEKIFRYDDKTLPDEINTYDSKDHITLRKNMHYNTAGAIVAWKTTQYDVNGRMTESKYFAWDSTQVGRTVFTYDADGRRKEIIEFGRNGILKSKIVTSYEPNGNETEITYDANGAIEYKTTRTYVYDSWGNWIRKTERTLTVKEPRSDHTRITTRTIAYYPAK